MKIVVVGSSNTDMIVKVPRIPKPGRRFWAGNFPLLQAVKAQIRLWLQLEQEVT